MLPFFAFFTFFDRLNHFMLKYCGVYVTVALQNVVKIFFGNKEMKKIINIIHSIGLYSSSVSITVKIYIFGGWVTSRGTYRGVRVKIGEKFQHISSK